MSQINRIGRVRIIGSSGLSGLSSGWFGYGQDGELSVKTNEVVELPVEQDVGYIKKNYTNLTIEQGGTLRPSTRNNSTILLVKGNLVVNGTIDVSKCAPLANDAEDAVRRNPHIVLANSSSPSGYFVGGKGGNGANYGGIGGNGFWCGGGYGGGGGGGINRQGGDSEPRPYKGLDWPWRGTYASKQQFGCGGSCGSEKFGALGGAAPGGSPAHTYYYNDIRDEAFVDEVRPGGAGDAYGGGALWIFVEGDVHIGPTGKIISNGGMGASGTYNYTYHIYDLGNGEYEVNRYQYTPLGSGGSGGGGVIFIAYGGTYTNYGTVAASGGAQPAAGSAEMRGQAGSVGTVKVISFSDLMRGA